MKFFRILLGVILLLGGLYVVVGEYLSGTSADATINARTTVLRAPIQGLAEFSVRTIGARISPEEAVVRITDNQFDNARLIDLERTRSTLEADLTRLRAQTGAVDEARKILDAQAKSYQEGRVRQIRSRIAEAQTAVNSAEARFREADSALDRTKELNSRGVQTAITLDRAQAQYDVAKQDIASTRERITYLTAELSSAQNGVFIGDSYNDAPFSIQRIREFDLRLAELRAEAENVSSRLKLVTEQIAAERVRVNRLTAAELSVQNPAIVWNFLASSGEHVNQGQDLVRFVDCSAVMVTASVSERVYSSLRVGMPAQFRLIGDDRVLQGTITRLGGSGAAGLYSTLAIGPSPEHLTRFDVALSIPELASDPDLSCAVGRTGRVVFTGGPLAGIRQRLADLGL
ncbi:HlyD family secretion protein [Microvirga mediterraneensis]|uniref:HlyD family efflux transporter periplasmic adaptor subunit n=1 Tax=Microvirga mediterraneensis TaxID=2754695 RepID=A0A838BRS4_9HYPH|nr:HlyD family efflux transporter periplasmic adaptor subunit [Microvirga mediterraneensis]MBA1157682.1 HlyD family efflux transporter periplasmic adaptor subunit [Microvirga mediterraneensis]